MPSPVKPEAMTKLPQPHKTNQAVPINSAIKRLNKGISLGLKIMLFSLIYLLSNLLVYHLISYLQFFGYTVAMNTLVLVALLLFKHFVCDFLMQSHYQVANKIFYGHLGGLIHALIHGVGTFVVFIFFYSMDIALLCAAIDVVVHYHVDWLKAVITSKFKLKIDNDTRGKFWALFGLDQFIHQMTYLALIVVAPLL
jgi:hypothetical protein